jgi:uncharacterized protein with NRDE domain
MCTVSYLPLSDHGYILSSNRDEAPARNALEIVHDEVHHGLLIFPRDPESGGTWFSSSDIGITVCLLNGAFSHNLHAKSYQRSRGHIALDLFNYDDFEAFLNAYNFNGLADFTLVVCSGKRIYELKWDGKKPSVRQLDPSEPHFWSSVTLYPEPVRRAREQLFKEWLLQHDRFEQGSIVDFHRYGGTGDKENDFVMNRSDIVKTLSITSVKVTAGKLNFLHRDLTDNREIVRELPIKSSAAIAQQK